MSREGLRAALAAYRARYPDESSTVDRFVALLDARPDCFERGCFTPGHITASTWLLDPSGGRVLLTHHRKLGRWLQLGGHADGDTDLLRAALREATEESGLKVVPVSRQILDLDVHTIPGRGVDPAHFHFDVRFALRAAGSGAFTVSDESHALRWVDIDAIATVTTEGSILRMAQKWRAAFAAIDTGAGPTL
jgi:8-oxo-dGTP pyrophosphatase MutT (NUDIX family)